ncbi:MAG: DEAD/DEAH box helicase family protein [Sediminibacterium sp.]
MNKILLPTLYKEKKVGKNLIKQLIFDSVSFKPESIEMGESFVVITNEKKEAFCIVQKGKVYPTTFLRVLALDKAPSVTNLFDTSNTLTWLEYPTLKEPYEPMIVRDTWEDNFFYKEENNEKNISGLRKPQIAAIFSVLSHWKTGEDIGTVVMPTGTGKTETMLSLLVANKCTKLLVVVPSDPLREQLSEKFISFGYLQKENFEVIGSRAKKPIVGVLLENFKDPEELEKFISQCNVIITTMDLISSGSSSMQGALASQMSNIFIDEAHHIKAPTWTRFRDLCEKFKILQFTATPYRNDGQSLDGKLVYVYSLKKAQEDGYFKRINLIQVNEWDNAKADEVIAAAAVLRLKEDLKKYDHLLMARCSTQTKANAVHNIYAAKYPEYNPVVIHTGMSQRDRVEAKRKIMSKESKIIVCVDMLGEGFDLPSLKIAAFHDIRKSLPITIQLAGRFTRTKIDEQLGEASIIVNLKDSDVTKELEDFYALGADWNVLLPMISTNRINKEVEFTEFLNGFAHLSESNIPFQSLKPALSTVVYKNHTNNWFPNNFINGLKNTDELDYLFKDINSEKKTLIIVTGKQNSIDWGHSKDIYNIDWSLFVIHWDTRKNLLFINASENAGTYGELAKAIIGEETEIIDKINVFKAFYGIERVTLKNVGLKEFLGRNISFSMRTGFNIEMALKQADKEGTEKAFVAGSGFENGEKVSLGCSYKGRIWSLKRGDIQELVEWFGWIGGKLIMEGIDPNTILKETLIPNSIYNRPSVIPFSVDWNESVFLDPETRITFIINGVESEFYNTELQVYDPSVDGSLIFELVTENETVRLKQELFNNGRFDDFKIVRLAAATETYMVKIGNRQISLEDFFYRNPITWWFVDGSSLSGNDYVELKHLVNLYPKEQIKSRNWDGVDLSKEAQRIEPKENDSIQYNIIQELKAGDYDVIYDDDYSGEIADIITIKQFDDYINIQLFHLKFAKEGKAAKRVDDLYEVCGQAMKSVNWKFKESKEFFDHLLRREIKKRKGKSCSRIEVGSKEKLTLFREIARKRYPVEFEIFIVQPGLSKSNASESQLSLLGVADSYLKGKADISLTIIGSE